MPHEPTNGEPTMNNPYVSCKVDGEVAVITMNKPPVNGLGFDLRNGVAEALDEANANAAVKAIVLAGTPRAFSGGADVTEFGTPKALRAPNLRVVIACSRQPQPIAAIPASASWGCAGDGRDFRSRPTRLACRVKLDLLPGRREGCRVWSGSGGDEHHRSGDPVPAVVQGHAADRRSPRATCCRRDRVRAPASRAPAMKRCAQGARSAGRGLLQFARQHGRCRGEELPGAGSGGGGGPLQQPTRRALSANLSRDGASARCAMYSLPRAAATIPDMATTRRNGWHDGSGSITVNFERRHPGGALR
jgi:hypothetical protein